MKLYVGERLDDHVEAAVGVGRSAANAVAVSAIMYPEVSAALAAKARAGHISRDYFEEAVAFLRRDLQRLYLVRPVTGAVLGLAGMLPTPVPASEEPEAGRHALKGYDAVQLATALTMRDELLERAKQRIDPREAEPGQAPEPHPEELLVLSFDDRLHDACVAEGIAHARPDRAGGRTFSS